MGRKLMGFGTAWLERQVFVIVCMCVSVCMSVCLWFCLSAFVSNVFSMSLAYVWKGVVCVCVCVCVSLYLSLCIFYAAFSVDKPHSSITQPVLLLPGWPVKLYLEHQSLWELWPLNHCEQSDNCHLLRTPPTYAHTHKCTEKCTAIEGQECTWNTN